MARVQYHPEAATEYQEALAWYRARSPQAAAGFRSEIRRVLGVIAATPDFYPSYDDDFHYALLLRYPFTIVYQPLTGRIYVVAVAHTRREPDYWRGRA